MEIQNYDGPGNISRGNTLSAISRQWQKDQWMEDRNMRLASLQQQANDEAARELLSTTLYEQLGPTVKVVQELGEKINMLAARIAALETRLNTPGVSLPEDVIT